MLMMLQVPAPARVISGCRQCPSLRYHFGPLLLSLFFVARPTFLHPALHSPTTHQASEERVGEVESRGRERSGEDMKVWGVEAEEEGGEDEGAR